MQYAAVNSAGSNLAIAGKAGFALYASSRRKWKLFGNEVQEQGLVCRGGMLWYEDIIVFPCRVQEHSEEVRDVTCVRGVTCVKGVTCVSIKNVGVFQ